MKSFSVILFAVVFFTAAIAAFVWSGIYNVAATTPHRNVTIWFIKGLRDRSIAIQSGGIVVPTLKDPKLAEKGLRHYHATCRLCHGAPAYSKNEFARGLNPPSPDLASEQVQKRKDAELYWIIKNGIKMTGMPAFGQTHDDDELWGITVFLRRLPNLEPKEYKAMTEAARLHDGGEIPHHHR